ELGAGVLEIVAGIFLFALQEHVAVGDPVLAFASVEIEIEDIVDALHIHGETLETVSELARDGIAVEAAHLLEVGELRYFHAVAPDFPAEPPGAERRALPIIFDEADVVVLGIDADSREAFEIEVLDVWRRRLQHHLELVVMLEPVRVLAIAAIFGPARWLDEGGTPGLGAERAQRRRRVKGPRPHLHVVGLEDDAA